VFFGSLEEVAEVHIVLEVAVAPDKGRRLVRIGLEEDDRGLGEPNGLQDILEFRFVVEGHVVELEPVVEEKLADLGELFSAIVSDDSEDHLRKSFTAEIERATTNPASKSRTAETEIGITTLSRKSTSGGVVVVIRSLHS